MKTINFLNFKSILINKEVWLHLLVWTLFLFSINVNWTKPWIAESFLPESVAPHIALSVPVCFLLNVFWLIPKYFNKEKWFHYVWISLSLLLVSEFVRTTVFTIVLHGSNEFLHFFKNELFGENSLIFGLLNVMTLTSIFYSFIYRFTRDWLIHQSVIKTLKLENQKLQLDSLQMVSDLNLLQKTSNEFNFLQSNKSASSIKLIRKTFSVKKRDGVFLLKIDNVLYFQAQGDFVFAFDKESNKHIINESLKSVKQQVCEKTFFQINRSELVNFNYISKYRPYSKNRLEIYLLNTANNVYTSNSRTPEFRTWLDQH